MTALVVVSPTLAPSYLVGLAVTIAVAVLAAHWGAYRPQVKRLIAASLIACALATVGAAVIKAEDEFIVRDSCADYEPWSLMWIAKGCMFP